MTDRKAALDAAMKSLEKDFGKGSAMRLGEAPSTRLDVIPTGSLAVDSALGIGGLPKGRICELYGPESSGKSTIALHLVANCQGSGGTAAYIDAEYSIDPAYARNLGVDTDSLILSQPSTFEEGMEIALRLIRSGGLDLVVFDSLAAMIPRAELEGDVGDAVVGLHARLTSSVMRKMTGPAAENNVCCLFINQLRSLIGGMGFGPTETTTGGKALRFYASVRLDCRRIATEKTADEATGNRTRVKVVKNKCAPPLKSAEFSIIYGEGISREVEILDLAIEHGLIQKSGAWFKYEGSNIAQGRAKAVDWLKDNPVICDQLEATIRGMM